MKMSFIPEDFKAEIRLRMDKIRRELEAAGADAVLVADNADVYYTTGRFVRGYVYVPRVGEPLWFVIRPSVFESSDSLVLIRKPEQIPDMLMERGIPLPGVIALEIDSLSYSETERLKHLFSQADMVNGSAIMRNARLVKTEYEISEISKDGMHQAQAYSRIRHIYKEGMTDLEFQIEIERILRLEGCLGRARVAGRLMEINMGSVISGENADTPSPYDFSMGGAGVDSALPVGADGTTMKPGTTVMVDMNGCFNGYQSDLTRVWAIGYLPDLAAKAHECARRILRECEKTALPGVEVCELYKRAEAIAEEEGLKAYFMGHTQKAGFIGHGVGIELNEQPPITPRNRTLLQAGMVLALEPKFVIPEVGAVGPENTYVVREDGLHNLTPYPEEIEVL